MDFKYSEPNFAPNLQAISKLFGVITSNRTELSCELSNVDQRLSDLDHALELLHLDAIGLTKIVKRRADLLKERRKIKDEIEFIDAINKSGISPSVVSDSIKKVAISVENIRHKHNERTYIPKTETDVFNATVYAKNIGKKVKDEEKDRIIKNLTYTDNKGKTHKPSKKAIRMEQKFDQIARELHK